MVLEIFALKSHKDAERFDALLHQWQMTREGSAIQYFQLVTVWDAVQGNQHAGRIFAAAFDLQLHLAFLPVDLQEVARVLNRDLHQQRKPQDSILNNPEHFLERLDLLRKSQDYIFRYRAVWDKIMGLLVLLSSPENYDTFCKADSRKAEFKRIATQTRRLPMEFVENVIALLTEFDNAYRTAEVHGSGRMRKFALAVQSEEDHPAEMLIWAWNDLNDVLHKISRLFEGMAARGPVA